MTPSGWSPSQCPLWVQTFAPQKACPLFPPKSGHWQCTSLCLLWVKADIGAIQTPPASGTVGVGIGLGSAYYEWQLLRRCRYPRLGKWLLLSPNGVADPYAALPLSSKRGCGQAEGRSTASATAFQILVGRNFHRFLCLRCNDFYDFLRFIPQSKTALG